MKPTDETDGIQSHFDTAYLAKIITATNCDLG